MNVICNVAMMSVIKNNLVICKLKPQFMLNLFGGLRAQQSLHLCARRLLVLKL
jgi:hypothetical protein